MRAVLTTLLQVNALLNTQYLRRSPSRGAEVYSSLVVLGGTPCPMVSYGAWYWDWEEEEDGRGTIFEFTTGTAFYLSHSRYQKNIEKQEKDGVL